MVIVSVLSLSRVKMYHGADSSHVVVFMPAVVLSAPPSHDPDPAHCQPRRDQLLSDHISTYLPQPHLLTPPPPPLHTFGPLFGGVKCLGAATHETGVCAGA